jgi:hypothetical protein
MPQTNFNFSALQLKRMQFPTQGKSSVQARHSRMSNSMYVDRRGQTAPTNVRWSEKASKTMSQYYTTQQSFNVQPRLNTNAKSLYFKKRLSNLLDVKSPIFASDTFKPGSGWRSEPMVTAQNSPVAEVSKEPWRRSFNSKEHMLKHPVYNSITEKINEVQLQLPLGMSSRLAEHMLNGYVKDRLLEKWATKKSVIKAIK